MKRILLPWLILTFKATDALSNDASSEKAQKLKLFMDSLTRAPKEVEFFKTKAGVEATSGYIMVKPLSCFFYLLVKAPKTVSNAPLILWLNGGPGKSGLYGQFLENGPIGIDAEGRLYNRSSTFQKFADVLYVDFPAGGGLSVIGSPSVLSTSLKDVTDDLMSFIKKFYELFKDYRSRNLYLVGESYGARAAVTLAERMRNECANPPRGIVLCAGFLTPLKDSILKSETFLYHLGLVDERGRAILATAFQNISLVAQKNTTLAAFLLGLTVFNFKINGTKSLFARLTGYDDQGSILHTTKPAEVDQYMQFVNNTDFKDGLGVPPTVNLEGYRMAIQFALAPGDYFANITASLQNVLSSENVLIVNGQMDDIFPPVRFDEYFRTLTWNGSAEFAGANRMPWSIATKYGLAGYMKQSGKLAVALTLGAGHLLGLDASDAVYDIVYRFVNGSLLHNEQMANKGV